MSTLRRIVVAGAMAGSMAAIALPAAAANIDAVEVARPNVVVEPRCCGGWPFGWFSRGYSAPAYYGGPESGATYAYYHGSNFGRRHRAHRRQYDQ